MITSNPSAYAPGTVAYARSERQYGRGGADQIYAAALAGQNLLDVYDRLSRMSTGSTSTTAILATQLYNEPLQAPIEDLSRVVENTVKTSLGNWGIWVLVAVGLGAFLLWRKV